jgi:hypothetical protein
VRLPRTVAKMFPRAVRRGYYYKINRKQAQRICNALSKEYGIRAPTVALDMSPHGANAYYFPDSETVCVWPRSHMKSTFHEWYHHLDHATRGRYNSHDRQGGPSSLAWQFADRLFDVLRTT